MSGGRRHARRNVGLGALMGLLRWHPVALATMVPQVAEMTGIEEGAVVASVLSGAGLVGAMVLLTPAKARRQRVARWAAGLQAVPLASLPFLPASAAVWALALIGALTVAAESAVQSALLAATDEGRRRRSFTEYLIAITATAAVGGVVCEQLVGGTGAAGFAAALWWLVPLTAVSGWWAGRVCPNPDRGGAVDGRPTRAARGERRSRLWWARLWKIGGGPGSRGRRVHGSLLLLIASRMTVNAALSLVAVYVPLTLAERGVSGVGWTQIAPLIGVLAAGVTSVQTSTGEPLVSTRRVALWGPMVISGAAALALVVELTVDAWRLDAVAGAVICIVASVGSGLHGVTIGAEAGATPEGKAGHYMGTSFGALVAAGLGAFVWSPAGAGANFWVVACITLALGPVGALATAAWLLSRRGRRVPTPQETGRWWGLNDALSPDQARGNLAAVLDEVQAGRTTQVLVKKAGSADAPAGLTALFAPVDRATTERPIRTASTDAPRWLEAMLRAAADGAYETLIERDDKPVAVVVAYDPDRDHVGAREPRN